MSDETLAEFADRIKRAVSQEVKPYDAGYDCGLNGPNTTNCAIANFATRERTREWERGKADAERVTPTTPQPDEKGER